MDDSFSLGGFYTVSILILVFWVLSIVAMWRIFEKAGRSGWLSIIPIVNTVVLLQISGYSGWTIFLLMIPFVNIIFAIFFSLRLAEKFGKSQVFGLVALFFFTIIGYFILGYGDATYQDDSAVSAPVAA